MKHVRQAILFIPMVLFLNLTPGWALDEIDHETKLKKGFELPLINKPFEIQYTDQIIYNAREEDFEKHKYKLEFALELYSFFEFKTEMKYIDNKNGSDDYEEIEINPTLWQHYGDWLKMEDENKFIINLGNGNQEYENELEFTIPIWKLNEKRRFNLLLGSINIYDFEEDEWAEHEFNFGLQFEILHRFKLEAKWANVDVTHDDHDCEKIATELVIYF